MAENQTYTKYASNAGAIFTALNAYVDVCIITGSLANFDRLKKDLLSNLRFIEQTIIYPGNFELGALANGVYHALSGELKLKVYK